MDTLLFMPNIEKMFLSVADIAHYLNCSSSTVYILIRSGRLPAYKKGREYQILTEDLFRYIKAKAHTFDQRNIFNLS